MVGMVDTEHRGRARRARTAAALLTVTGLFAAGCTGHGTPRAPADDGRGQFRTARPSTSPPKTSEPSEEADGPSVLAVKIDNVRAARPQTGIDSADVVYAEQVEGGLSRLMAVYATKLPKTVGPVRSARESDLELLRQFDRPTLAFSGAQGKLMPLINRAPLVARPPRRRPAPTSAVPTRPPRTTSSCTRSAWYPPRQAPPR